MEQTEIAGKIIAHLRKYGYRALMSPGPFSQKLGCAFGELRAVQLVLLENKVITCVSYSVSAPEYELLGGYQEGDEWQKFFPEIKKNENSDLDPLSIELHKALTKLAKTQETTIRLAKEVRRLEETCARDEEQKQRYKDCILQLQIKLDEKNAKDNSIGRANQELLAKVENNDKELSTIILS